MLEKIQESVRLNQAYISAMCEANYNARFAWRWREDYWGLEAHDNFNP